MKKLAALFILLLVAGGIALAAHDEEVVGIGQVTWPQFYNGTSFHHPRIEASTRMIATVDIEDALLHQGKLFGAFITEVIAESRAANNEISVGFVWGEHTDLAN